MTLNYFLLGLLFASTSFAQLDEASFKQALKVKKGAYITEGSFTGGDRTSSDFRVTQIRVAANPEGYDRIVIDLGGSSLGEKAPLARPPFYLIEADSGHHKVNVTVYGKPKLDFSTQTSIQAAKKSKTVSSLEFLPLVNADRWTWTIHTQVPVKTEVFELSEPARIIIDLKK